LDLNNRPVSSDHFGSIYEFKRKTPLSTLTRAITGANRKEKKRASLLPESTITFTNPDYESWLFVKNSNNKKWKKRWCVLKDGVLYLCKSPTVNNSDSLFFLPFFFTPILYVFYKF